MIEDSKAPERYAREEQKMGNEKTSENSAEVTQPAITDAMADAALNAIARGVACKPNCSYEQHRRGEMAAALQTAYPAIRQQVAEEIAQAIESELDAYGSYGDQVLTRAAKIARVHATARPVSRPALRTGAPATTDLPPTLQAGRSQ